MTCTASGKGWACDRPGPICAGHRKQKSRGERFSPLRARRTELPGARTAQTYELTEAEHAELTAARGEEPESAWVAEAIRRRLKSGR